MSLVAIVGRPNVGKSTLFNRLVGQRQAIVDSTAGTTRDRHYGRTDWNGKEFSVIDTGGYTVNSEDIFEDEIRRQVLLAIDEADVILFLVEVATGVTDLDMMMADILRRSSKKVLLICNKVDNNDQIYLSHEFYSLGLGDPYCISSMSGSGTGDMMDAILAALPEDAAAEEEDDLLVREKVIDVTPMTEEQALVQTDLLGHDFYVFENATTGLINVVYHRKNGGYGIIKPRIETLDE